MILRDSRRDRNRCVVDAIQQGLAPSMNISVMLKVSPHHGRTAERYSPVGVPAQWTMSDKQSSKQLPQSCLDATLFPQSAGYINSIVHKSIHFRAAPIPTEQQARQQSIWNVPPNHAVHVRISNNRQVKSTALVIHVQHQSTPSSFTSMPRN